MKSNGKSRSIASGVNQRALVVVLACLAGIAAGAELPAFPGADGAAAYVTGGRGGVVYHVTKLDRNFSDNREGTLRYGLNNSNFSGNRRRTIVFDVAGTFWLGRYGADRGHHNGWDTQSRINIGDNVTIAGQTAPGPVNIMGGAVKISSENVILRNLTVAPGYGMRSFEKPDSNPPELPQPGDFPDSYVYDAIDISGQGVMISHVTTLYATDEAISANEQARDITMQYCNISQGQNYPQADAEGGGRYTGHALASLLQGGSNARISVVRNLYAHQKGRLPRVGSEEGTGAINDFRNNVFYNWFGTAGGGAGGQPSKNNFIHNFYLVGPGGDDVSGPNIITKSAGTGVFDGRGSTWTKAFVQGNLKDTNRDGDPDDGTSADSSYSGIGSQSRPYYDESSGVLGVTVTAEEAFRHVTSHVGARWWERDYHPGNRDVNAIDSPDERLIHETLTGTGRIMAWADDPFDDDPAEGNEWRNLLALRADPGSGEAPFKRPADWDTDGDGMPNDWEKLHELPVDAANNNSDFDNDGYTDLEEYLNDIAAWPAPRPIVFVGVNDRYAEIHNWLVTGVAFSQGRDGGVQTQTHWQPSRYDTVLIDGASVVVDAVGQHAGTLYLGTQADSEVVLDVTAGWLKVAGQLVIGAEPESVAGLNLSGGQLHVETLSKGSAGLFRFTGGQLQAKEVAFDLVNDGGRLIPAGTGVLHIAGDLHLNHGDLEINIHAADRFQVVRVDGNAFLGGNIHVELDGFVPGEDDVFEVITASGCQGSFTNAGSILETAGGTFQVLYTTSAVRLTGYKPK